MNGDKMDIRVKSINQKFNERKTEFYFVFPAFRSSFLFPSFSFNTNIFKTKN